MTGIVYYRGSSVAPFPDDEVRLLFYVARRTLYALFTVFLALTLVFLIFFVLPGGAGKKEEGVGEFSPVAVLLAGRNTEPDRLAMIEKRLGLDRPLHQQYVSYLARIAHGNLGYSFQSEAPVTPIVKESIAPTAQLALGASFVWLVLGVGAGTFIALRRGTWGARLTTGLGLLSMALPVFVTAILGVALFDGVLGIYEANSYVYLTDDPRAWLGSMWLPWITLALAFAGLYLRMTRGALLEIEHEDYLRTARAKGLENHAVVRHQMRAGLSPVITMYGADLGLLLGGSIITEQIFNIPGLGLLALGALSASDFPIISGITVVTSVFVILANLMIDIAYAFIDPRVSYS